MVLARVRASSDKKLLQCRREIENMSMGYIPKKRKKVRHQRRMRKKYKNFSCETCRYAEGFCRKRSRISEKFVKCEYWKASEKAKHPEKFKKESNKKPRKGIFGRIFDN